MIKNSFELKGGKFKMDNKILAGALIIGIVLIAGYLAVNSSGAVVSARGEGVLEATPDEVSVGLNVMTKNLTAQDAKDAHDKIVDDLMIGLLRAGLEKKDIKVVSYNIYPEYDYTDGRPKQIGFLVQQDFVVETEDFELVPEIVDAGIEAGALISYINFELSEDKQKEFKASALEEASADAKSKAEATANGLGKKLGSLVSVKNEDFYYGPYPYFAAAEGAKDSASAREAALNLSPRDIEVRASIVVEYKLRAF